ncbi:hypothetical protein OGAPHI_002451 [Ogataea philodendri]|uniref:Uncharacterized protein n=1 Tax=Ogataea philodendri TaxID=1378263 RepID=A0A9P8PCD3_9ASCO|nr:uncharacterized protein OGAPHI_002451 [Ogataea philodendri]KAH3668697.1 hypothetical protein OGAPHI_002451 [Ogataea philodendri]
MRELMVTRSSSHCFFSSGVLRINDTILAPYAGGFDSSDRTILDSCDRTALLSAASWSGNTTCTAPTRSPYMPAFLANDWQTTIGNRYCLSTASRTAHASFSSEPDEKPWYAESNRAKWPPCSTALRILSHWSGVGSSPVGLCAVACNRNTDPCGAFLIASRNPSRSSDLVFASQYGYVAIFSPMYSNSWIWLAQVGCET